MSTYMAECRHSYKADTNQSQFNLCPDCRAKVFGSVANMTGSEKQITWANDIRAKILGGMVSQIIRRAGYDFADKLSEQGFSALRKLAAISSAKWWIDHRNDSESMLIKSVM